MLRVSKISNKKHGTSSLNEMMYPIKTAEKFSCRRKNQIENSKRKKNLS